MRKNKFSLSGNYNVKFLHPTNYQKAMMRLKAILKKVIQPVLGIHKTRVKKRKNYPANEPLQRKRRKCFWRVIAEEEYSLKPLTLTWL